MQQAIIRLENFEGVESVIVSGGNKEFIEPTLRENSLETHFKRIYDSAFVRNGQKDYLGVLADLGVEASNAPDQCLVVSDKEEDSPHTQLKDNVFIHQPDGYRTSAFVIRDIARSLLEVGEGLFGRGFWVMHSSVTEVDTQLKLGSGRVRLDNGLQFTTRYLDTDPEEYIKPLISNIILPRDYEPLTFSIHLGHEPSATSSAST